MQLVQPLHIIFAISPSSETGAIKLERGGALRLLRSNRGRLDLSLAKQLCQETLHTLLYLTIYPAYLGYNVHPLILGI